MPLPSHSFSSSPASSSHVSLLSPPSSLARPHSPHSSSFIPRRSSRLRCPPDVLESPVRLPSNVLEYPYSFDLLAHHGCVNAISFSRADSGRWLASGGDDMKVILWDLFADFDQLAPVAAFDGPDANIFSIDFAVDGRRLFATGLDSRVFVYDLEYSSRTSSPASPRSPLAVLRQHTDSCRRVACHPQESNSILSAAEDGSVFHHDLRLPDRSLHTALLEARAEYTDVAWNPVSMDLFVASTNHSMRLYDRRVLASNPKENFSKSLVTYTTNLIKPKPLLRIGHPEISSVTFDQTGQLLGTMMSKWYPTIWKLDDPHPSMILKSQPTGVGHGGDGAGGWEGEGQERRSGDDGFRDICTIKHGSFSNDSHSNDTYFAAGSDDFRCYGWKLPSISDMVNQREEVVEFSKWLSGADLDTCAYGNKTITVPRTNSSPAFRLYGHRSIPNSLIFHPHFPLVFTCGVEKLVKVHSTRQIGWYAHQDCRSRAQVTSKAVRRKMSMVDWAPFTFGTLNEQQEHLRSGSGQGGPEEEDLQTLAMFDALLERDRDSELQSLWLGLENGEDEDEDDGEDHEDEVDELDDDEDELDDDDDYEEEEEDASARRRERH